MPNRRAEWELAFGAPHLWCAIRELDGQRHALRESVDWWFRIALNTGRKGSEAKRERDAAIERAGKAEARVRELEAELAELGALTTPAPDEPEPFDSWHARECPLVATKQRACSVPSERFCAVTITWGRFAGRTCREVYEAEVLNHE